MIDFNGSSLESLKNSYLVANTPMFIVRSFRSNATVSSLAKNFSAAELLAELRRRRNEKLQSVEDYIIPLAILMALSFKRDKSSLEQAANLDFGGHRWFKAVARAVLQSYRPVSSVSLQMPQQSASRGLLRENASSSFVKIEAGAA